MSYYIIPPNTNKIDGVINGIKPGDVLIVAEQNKYSEPLHFSNIKGELGNPVVITSAGSVTLDVGPRLSYTVKMSKCSHIKVSSEMKITGGNKDSMGISVEDRSTDIEIEGVELFNNGFTSIMCKDNQSFLGEWVMRNIKIHHCYMHDTRNGEGIYAGNSATIDDKTKKVTHALTDCHIFSNRFKNTAREAIQLGRCLSGGKVYDNLIEDSGIGKVKYQTNGLQIGEGTKAEIYNNVIHRSVGNGMIIMGTGCNTYKNKIFSAGENGIYCDDRADTVEGFTFSDNTIVNPVRYCMTIEANKGLVNEVRDSMLLNPGISAPLTNPFINHGSIVVVNEHNNYLRGKDGWENMELAEHLMKKP